MLVNVAPVARSLVSSIKTILFSNNTCNKETEWAILNISLDVFFAVVAQNFVFDLMV